MTPSTNRPLSLGERLSIGCIIIGFAALAAGVGATMGYALTFLLTIPGFGVVIGATAGALYAINEISKLTLGD